MADIIIKVKFRRNNKERYWEVANTSVYWAFDILKKLVEETKENIIQIKIEKVKK